MYHFRFGIACSHDIIYESNAFSDSTPIPKKLEIQTENRIQPLGHRKLIKKVLEARNLIIWSSRQTQGLNTVEGDW